MEKPLKSYWELMKPFLDSINIYDGPEVYAASIRDLPRSVVLLYAAHFAEYEICNGGFKQLFTNSTGVLVPEGTEGFALIGMPTCSSLLSEAAESLGTPYPRERKARWEALFAISGHSTEEIEHIFKEAINQHVAFAKATKSVSFRSLEKQFYENICVENGGFQEAATAYARIAQP